MRSFTAKDRKAIRLVAQNFPPSAFYDIEHLLTNLGTGEALVTALDGDGAPTPLIQCRLRAPESRMGVLESTELAQLLRDSALMKKYGKRVNRDSAKEQIVAQKAEPSSAPERNTSSKKSEPASSVVESLSKNTLVRQLVRQFFRQITTAILAALGLGKKRKKSRK